MTDDLEDAHEDPRFDEEGREVGAYVGICTNGCCVTLRVPIDAGRCFVQWYGVQAARELAAALMEKAEEAEQHPDNAGERRH